MGIVAIVNYHDQTLNMIPVVINTWPFTNATQNGKYSNVIIRRALNCPNPKMLLYADWFITWEITEDEILLLLLSVIY